MSASTWGGRRAVAALNQVKAEGRRNNTPCCLWYEDIDYSLPSTEPYGCTVQHVKSGKLFPALTRVPSNWAPAYKSSIVSAAAGSNLQNPGVTWTEW